MMIAEQTEYDGRAKAALEDIRTGKIYERQSKTSRSGHPVHPAPADNLRESAATARHHDEGLLEEMIGELEDDNLLVTQTRLEESERAAESIDVETDPDGEDS
jgi:hypothetical protein